MIWWPRQFLYPDWWINQNIDVLEEREKTRIANFPTPEITASRIDAILAFDRIADLLKIKTPTLIICAKDDFLTPPYYSRELAGAFQEPNSSTWSRADIARQKPTHRRSIMPSLVSLGAMLRSAPHHRRRFGTISTSLRLTFLRRDEALLRLNFLDVGGTFKSGR